MLANRCASVSVSAETESFITIAVNFVAKKAASPCNNFLLANFAAFNLSTIVYVYSIILNIVF